MMVYLRIKKLLWIILEFVNNTKHVTQRILSINASAGCTSVTSVTAACVTPGTGCPNKIGTELQRFFS